MPRWTPQARRKQAEAIRQWGPWTASTGPRSEAGKRESARNGPKHPPRLIHPKALRRQAAIARKLLKADLQFGLADLAGDTAMLLFQIQVLMGQDPVAAAEEILGEIRRYTGRDI